MSSQLISVYVRNVYGIQHVYVSDAELAATLAKLTRSKTLLPEHIDALKTLGFTFEQVPDPRAKTVLSL